MPNVPKWMPNSVWMTPSPFTTCLYLQNIEWQRIGTDLLPMVRPILHKKRSEIAVIILTVVVCEGGGGVGDWSAGMERQRFTALCSLPAKAERASFSIHRGSHTSRKITFIFCHCWRTPQDTHLLHSIKNVHLSLDALENRIITLSVQLAICWWDDDSIRSVSWV